MHTSHDSLGELSIRETCVRAARVHSIHSNGFGFGQATSDRLFVISQCVSSIDRTLISMPFRTIDTLNVSESVWRIDCNGIEDFDDGRCRRYHCNWVINWLHSNIFDLFPLKKKTKDDDKLLFVHSIVRWIVRSIVRLHDAKKFRATGSTFWRDCYLIAIFVHAYYMHMLTKQAGTFFFFLQNCFFFANRAHFAVSCTVTDWPIVWPTTTTTDNGVPR